MSPEEIAGWFEVAIDEDATSYSIRPSTVRLDSFRRVHLKP